MGYVRWHGVCNFAVYSVGEICVAYGGVYEIMGLVMTLYMASIVSFCITHVVDVRTLSICIVLRAFVVVTSMCLLYVSLGQRVSLRILGLMFMGSVMLSICSSSCVLYSAGSGVKRVYVCFVWIERLFV